MSFKRGRTARIVVVQLILEATSRQCIAAVATAVYVARLRAADVGKIVLVGQAWVGAALAAEAGGSIRACMRGAPVSYYGSRQVFMAKADSSSHGRSHQKANCKD